MIRCDNCGWSANPDGSIRCEKCKSPLNAAASVAQQPVNQPESDFNPNKTVREMYVSNDAEPTGTVIATPEATPAPEPEIVLQATPSNCPKCGYPIRKGSTNCPQCGTEIAPATPTINIEDANTPEPAVVSAENPTPEPVEDFGKTVFPSRGCRCSLTMVLEEGEKKEVMPVDFTEAEVVLNRENTEPGNRTITREAQAVLTYENKRWYIENKSAMNTTMIVVQGKMELRAGDVIMLGDRKFEFDY